MSMRTGLIAGLSAAMILAGCQVDTTTSGTPEPDTADRIPASRAQANFAAVVRRVEPVAERVCAERTRNMNCDFRIVVDSREGLPPNAFQTLDKSGRPVIGFTLALIADARNQDELAFVLGHEAAHHIRGHIATSQQRATEGVILGAIIGAAIGLDAGSIQTAQQIGGSVNARRFAKEFELEADQLGTIIAARAGYDPVRGAAFFTRIPDPGDRFLGTHPPNADRIRIVRQTAARL